MNTRIDPLARRGLKAVFWIVLALAVGIGGPSALAGLPRLVLPEDGQAANTGAVKSFATVPLLASRAAFVAAVPFTAPPREAVERRRTPPPGAAAIAIVIDDMGGDLKQNRRAIALPKAVSLSFLPDPANTPLLVREAQRAGHEILAHVPMEAGPEHANDPSLAMALHTDYPADENIRRLDWALVRVRGYSGINNHEGSVFTQNRKALAAVAEALYGRGVFFLDSRTTADSQVVGVARGFGVPSAGRDVFLDDARDENTVRMELRELEKTARKNGVAIAIGHPHDVTLDALKEWCAQQHSFRLIPVSQAIKLKTEREMGLQMATNEGANSE
jgi:uncharacterized protein